MVPEKTKKIKKIQKTLIATLFFKELLKFVMLKSLKKSLKKFENASSIEKTEINS